MSPSSSIQHRAANVVAIVRSHLRLGRPCISAAGLSLALTAVASGTAAQTAPGDASNPPPLMPCPTVLARLSDPVSSATANVGDAIKFTTLPMDDGASGALPAGLTGYGLVTYAQHARRARGGEIGLEARYVVKGDGTKVPVSSVSANAVVKGSNRDAPAIFGAAGAFKGTLAAAIGGTIGFYDFIHYGAEASVASASVLHLVVGDGIEEGTCSSSSLITGNPNYKPRRDVHR